MGNSLEYLTTQDLLWVNQTVTGKKQNFHFAKVEEVANCQYAYRQSNDLAKQAAQFGAAFSKNPFAAGNKATGFIAFAAFLYLNGRKLTVKDGDSAEWYLGSHTADSVTENTVEHHDHHVSPRQALDWALANFGKSTKKLLAAEEGEFEPAKLHIRDVTSAL